MLPLADAVLYNNKYDDDAISAREEKGRICSAVYVQYPVVAEHSDNVIALL